MEVGGRGWEMLNVHHLELIAEIQAKEDSSCRVDLLEVQRMTYPGGVLFGR